MTIPYSNDTDGGDVDLIFENPVIIGTENTSATTATDCIAIGKNAGANQRLINNIAIGVSSGASQLINSIAIGGDSGVSQGVGCVAVGQNSAQGVQGDGSVCIGLSSGNGVLDGSISIGTLCNSGGAGQNSIGIGKQAKSESNNSIVINATGSDLINTTASSTHIAPLRANPATHQALLYDTTSKELLTQSVLTVDSINNKVSVDGEIATDRYLMNGSSDAIKIGTDAGLTTGTDCIAIGTNSGANQTGTNCIAIGRNSGANQSSLDNIAIGRSAGASQFVNSVAIGTNAGATQGVGCVAVGQGAGAGVQSDKSVCIGIFCGDGVDENSVSIGGFCNSGGAGTSSVGLGYKAKSQSNNSIVINASGSDLISTTANSTYIAPIRNVGSNLFLCYNSTSSEITTGDLQKVSPIEIGTNPDSATTGKIAIGEGAGATTTGTNCLLIGKGANASSNNNTIVLNASGSTFPAPFGNACFVDPIRIAETNTGTTRRLGYNSSTKEVRAVQDGIVYGNLLSGTRDSTTATTVGITVVYNSNSSVFSISAGNPNQIQIGIEGHYKINFVANMTTTAPRSSVRYSVFQNGIELTQSRANNYFRSGVVSINEGSLSGHCISEFQANDLIEFKYIRLDNSLGSVSAITTRYIMEKLN